MPVMLDIPVNIPGGQYPIFLGEGLLGDVGTLLQGRLPGKRVVVISDDLVSPLYASPVLHGLNAAGFASEHLTVPAGEGSKSWDALQRLLDTLLARTIDRKTTLLALGGGVIGDLVGFAAAIALRGLSFVQVPTTLLAQVDSSVGGKTGINTAAGKNMVGAFYQPLAVMMDSATLSTLPPRHLQAGYAEILKYGLLGDAAFFAWLEENGKAVLARTPNALHHAIAHSCRAKAAIVAADEKEQGVRALLNLGHTFGHALEAVTGYGDQLHHGEAVAMGCRMAFQLSVSLGLCPASDAQRVERHLNALGYPATLPTLVSGQAWDSERLLQAMEGDKKNSHGQKTFVLAKGIGETVLQAGVPDETVRTVLQRFGAS
jgi:3-dehydroquinate synthase